MIDAKTRQDPFHLHRRRPVRGRLPAHLADASAEGGDFVKAKMTRKTITWALASDDLRIVMQENRRTGEVRKIIVKQDGDTVLRFKGGLGVDADAVRKAVAKLDGFETQPLVRVFNTVAQKVVGTSGDEFVRGGNKDDKIKAKGGDDRYFAGKGDDKVDLGGGDDTANYSELNRGIKADLRKGVVNKGKGDKDDVKGVENLTGTDSKDVLRGDGRDNRLDGQDGNDVVVGRGGDDFLYGGEGRDKVNGGKGNDSMFGGDGDDKLNGGRDHDLVYGDDGADRINGGPGSDTLFGGRGEDVLNGGSGLDAMSGGEDADVFVIQATASAGGPDQVLDYDAAEGDRLRLSGEAADYEVVVADGRTEIRRAGADEALAVLFSVEAPNVLDDALFI